MSNISNKQKVTAIAAIGAAAVFGMLSFGSSAQAARYSYNCHLWNVTFGVACCDRMTSSPTNSDCHGQKKIVLKRKLPPRLPPIIRLFEKEWVEGSRGDGGNSGDNKGKGPNGPY
jgi:hypothetical protein